MDDIVTMAEELLQAPSRGLMRMQLYVHEIEAAKFEIMHGLLTLVQNLAVSFGLDKEDPHATSATLTSRQQDILVPAPAPVKRVSMILLISPKPLDLGGRASGLMPTPPSFCYKA
ncbi:hypothetical protein Tco_0336289 [Tanacetum coccineum]